MDWDALAWLFAGAVTLHNVEEAVLLPRWSRTVSRWSVPVATTDFRFAVVVLTVLAYACAWISIRGQLFATYVLCGYALAMLLNAFIPHLAATIALRRYAPGTATAFCFNVPVASLLLYGAVTQHRIEFVTFAWGGPLTVIAIVSAIPLLFALGRRLRAWTGSS
ncbi:HXXEE domain-containing protein [Telmatospirillum sp.]|uniref:HXXEE domain-containing protein n=1 Tax=Telmatospirillum sp. TaxID=2079197 RepID=UPI00283D84AE|nr:HXXEE domain-containing protein [Telmatospirillum sp.]MDR3441318.1 HXXEE domain-containing protein [Telmatospirillum sp.]